MEAYSILMSVYRLEKPAFFAQALQSMMAQTVLTNDFVVVCDGPLTPELDAVLDRFDRQYPGIFHVIRLPENVGIGAAANIGLQHCKNDLVAKMDADDISVPDRCEKQLRMFENHPELAVLGGFMEEFDEDPNCPYALRTVPLIHEEIRSFARRRQPFSNVTVMYRRSAVLAVGGYRSMARSEDYDLYVRLLHKGYRAANLRDVLTKARTDRSAMSRRASWATLKGCAQSRWRAYRMGFSSLGDFLFCVTGQFVMFISPAKLQQLLYQKLFRRGCGEENEVRA